MTNGTITHPLTSTVGCIEPRTTYYVSAECTLTDRRYGLDDDPKFGLPAGRWAVVDSGGRAVALWAVVA